MDKLNNSKDAEKLLKGLGLRIDEAVVRQVVNVLSGKAHQSIYSLWATRNDKPAPVCGKGSVYKIKKLYDEGILQPYLDYLSDLLTIGEAKAEQTKEAKHDVLKESQTGQVPLFREDLKRHFIDVKALAKRLMSEMHLPEIEYLFVTDFGKPGIYRYHNKHGIGAPSTNHSIKSQGVGDLNINSLTGIVISKRRFSLAL
jgi:hypothetical protein